MQKKSLFLRRLYVFYKMRIAIISLQLHTNCGGVLQAYALQTVLQRLGHTVEILQKDEILPVPRGMRALWKCLSRGLRNLAGQDVEVHRERRINREFPTVGREYLEFFDKYLNIRYIHSFDEITPLDYDAFVVGSDQVWRPRYNPDLFHSYLDFTRGWKVGRIAFSVSFGTSAWEYSVRDTREASKLVAVFDALSFREESGCVNCRMHFGRDAEHIQDPTLLLSAEDYLEIVRRAGLQSTSPGGVYEYFLDRLPSDPRGRGPVEARIQEGPEKWIQHIIEAERIVTDSFHVCVFSILFHKNFTVERNERRGFARIEDLLRTFGLQEQMGAGESTDWAEVDARLRSCREKGMNFLRSNL